MGGGKERSENGWKEEKDFQENTSRKREIARRKTYPTNKNSRL